MRTVTIVVDSREQVPLPFPAHIKWHPRRSRRPIVVKIKTRLDKLTEGDYCIDGFADTCLIETKRSARELADNLLGADFQRADSAFARLSAATSNPLLMCEFGQAELLSEESDGRVADALSWACGRYGLSLWFAGPRSGIDARRKTAECAARYMLAIVDWCHPNFVRDTVKEESCEDEQVNPRTSTPVD